MTEEFLNPFPNVSDILPQAILPPPPEEEILAYFRIHPQTFEVLWNRTFLILGEAPLFPRPLSVAGQVVRDPRYRCDCRVRQGDTIRYFCYTLSGTGAISDASGSYRVTAGQGFLVETGNPLTSYWYPEDSREPWRFIAFAFHGLQSHVMVRALLQQYGPVYDLPIETRIIQRLLGFEVPNYSPGQMHVAQLQLHDAAELVTDLLMTLMASKKSVDEANSMSDPVQRAISIITTNETAELRVNDLANQIGISREHLSRLFQVRLGKSLRTFILEQKINRACLLLRETDMPIKMIADQLGYTAYTNFAHAFQQIMLVTPRQYRINGALPHHMTVHHLRSSE